MLFQYEQINFSKADALKTVLGKFGMDCVGGWYSTHLLKRNARDELKSARTHLDLLKAMGCKVFIAAETQGQFEALCTTMGKPELLSDARFVTNEARVANQDVLDDIISTWTAPRRRYEIQSVLQAAGVIAVAVQLPMPLLVERVTRRVDAQFARGIVTEVEGLLARGVPAEARPFGGLVYRQIMEMRRGVRDEAATRALIVQENRRYARRQLIWFRKEPNLIWFDGPGESPATLAAVSQLLEASGLP